MDYVCKKKLDARDICEIVDVSNGVYLESGGVYCQISNDGTRDERHEEVNKWFEECALKGGQSALMKFNPEREDGKCQLMVATNAGGLNQAGDPIPLPVSKIHEYVRKVICSAPYSPKSTKNLVYFVLLNQVVSDMRVKSWAYEMNNYSFGSGVPFSFRPVYSSSDNNAMTIVFVPGCG